MECKLKRKVSFSFVMYMTHNKSELEIAWLKQERWRQKQFYILYGSGRPIFQVNQYNQHMRRYYDTNIYNQLKKHKPYLNIDHEHFSKNFYDSYY